MGLFSKESCGFCGKEARYDVRDVICTTESKMVRDISLYRLTGCCDPTNSFQMLFQIVVKCVRASAIQLVKPPKRKSMPGNVYGSFIYLSKLLNILGAGVRPDKHRSCCLPDIHIFKF